MVAEAPYTAIVGAQSSYWSCLMREAGAGVVLPTDMQTPLRQEFDFRTLIGRKIISRLAEWDERYYVKVVRNTNSRVKSKRKGQ
jgi:hypothetical protein